MNFMSVILFGYRHFLEGMADGSGLTLDDCVILNSMETLRIPDTTIPQCLFLSLPPQKTVTGNMIIARNYDYIYPYNLCAQYLTVAILKETGKVPVAVIGLPGQIYCTSCINSKAIFIEVNNGMPCGGYYIDQGRKSLVINLLEMAQNSHNLEESTKQLNAFQSDYSLIINTANQTQTRSYEFSSTMGMKHLFPSDTYPFVSTNFYLNDTWQGIPNPTDDNTWFGITRRNNMLNLTRSKTKYNVDDVKKIMDVAIENGGTVWNDTIYQIIFDSNDLTLFVRPSEWRNRIEWTEISLGSLFDDSFQKNTFLTEAEIIIHTLFIVLIALMCFCFRK